MIIQQKALAEHTYTFEVKPQTNSCQVVFQAVNSKNGEVIPDGSDYCNRQY